jgi:hypothetical protein
MPVVGGAAGFVLVRRSTRACRGVGGENQKPKLRWPVTVMIAADGRTREGPAWISTPSRSAGVAPRGQGAARCYSGCNARPSTRARPPPHEASGFPTSAQPFSVASAQLHSSPVTRVRVGHSQLVGRVRRGCSPTPARAGLVDLTELGHQLGPNPDFGVWACVEMISTHDSSSREQDYVLRGPVRSAVRGRWGAS